MLAAAGAWMAIVPWLGRLLGLDVDVATRVEVVDHVIPGVVAAVAGLYLTRTAAGRPLASDRAAPAVAVTALLAGLWAFATHAPLLLDAARGDQPWAAAIWHSVAALPILVIAFWCVLQATARP